MRGKVICRIAAGTCSILITYGTIMQAFQGKTTTQTAAEVWTVPSVEAAAAASPPAAASSETTEYAAVPPRTDGQPPSDILSQAPGQAAEAPDQVMEAPGQVAEAPGQAAEAPGQAAEAPGQAAEIPNQGAAPNGSPARDGFSQGYDEDFYSGRKFGKQQGKHGRHKHSGGSYEGIYQRSESEQWGTQNEEAPQEPGEEQLQASGEEIPQEPGGEQLRKAESENREQQEYSIESQNSEEGDPPSLQQYLSLLRCGGCHHGCSLLSPHCRKGRSKADNAAVQYRQIYEVQTQEG